MRLGELVKARRREEGLTQGQLADQIGVTQQALGKWELGARPRAGHLRLLAEFLDRPYAEVVALADEELDPREEVGISAKLDQLLAGLTALNARVLVLEGAGGAKGEESYAPRDSNPEPNDSRPLHVVRERRLHLVANMAQEARELPVTEVAA